MIAFVEHKVPDEAYVRSLLCESVAANTWSNFGPVSRRLERVVADCLELPLDRRVVACANGTIGLHGLVELFAHLRGRSLRWVVSAFTFYAQRQGPLAEALVLDCDEHGFLDRDALARLPAVAYDGIIVSNLFGMAHALEDYVELAARHDKVLLFDSATCFGSRYAGKSLGSFGHAELFSFHHTKPCGFGEGGCVILDAALENAFRSLINFGLCFQIDTGRRSMNGKMSDVAAAYIADRLRRLDEIRAAQRREHARISAAVRAIGATLLIDAAEQDAVPNLVPIVFPHAIPPERLANERIVLHKYYRPIAPRPRADGLYGRIVSFPCHADVARLSEVEIRRVLEQLCVRE